jgi:hypothetical protein
MEFDMIRWETGHDEYPVLQHGTLAKKENEAQ